MPGDPSDHGRIGSTPAQPPCRRATLADFLELRALERAAFTRIGSRFYPLADIELALATLEGLSTALIEEGHYFVLQHDDGSIIASGGWSRAEPDYEAHCGPRGAAEPPRAEEATVRCVYVHPDHERRGHAGRIMRRIEADALSHGVCSLGLTSSKTALALYRHLRYAEERVRSVGLPNGRAIDLIQMRKSLLPGAASLPMTGARAEDR